MPGVRVSSVPIPWIEVAVITIEGSVVSIDGSVITSMPVAAVRDSAGMFVQSTLKLDGECRTQ